MAAGGVSCLVIRSSERGALVSFLCIPCRFSRNGRSGLGVRLRVCEGGRSVFIRLGVGVIDG